MPRIQSYDAQIAPQGSETTRATAADFDTGSAGMAALGQSLQGLGGQVMQVQEHDEINDIHTKMSQARMDWTATLADRANNAKPGDMSFAPTISTEMSDYFAKMGENVSTRKGQEVFRQLSGNLQSSFVDKAIGIQSSLAGAQARQDATVTQQNNATTLMTDPSQYDAIVAQDQAVIGGGAGNYRYLDQVTRQEFMQQNKEKYAWAAGYSTAEKNPAGFLQSAAPDAVALRMNGIPYGGAPGAVGAGGFGPPKSLSPAVMQYAPVVQQAAQAHGVDANILTAQIQQESRGNKDAISSAGAQGISQFMPDTATRFNVDVQNPQSSIDGQARYMAANLKMFGGDYAKALAAYNMGEGGPTLNNGVYGLVNKYGNDWLSHAPAETQNYVKTIMGNVAKTAPPVAVQAAQNPDGVVAPTAASIPGWADLPVDKKIALIGHAETRQNQIMAVNKAQLEQVVKNQTSQAMTTGDVSSPLPVSQFVQSYGLAEGTRKYNEEYKPMLDLGTAVKSMYGATTAVQDQTLTALKPVPDSPGFAAAQARYDALSQAVNLVRQQRNADPVQFAMANKMQGVQPLDMTTPENMAAGLSARVGPANALSQSFGTPAQYLTKPEAQGMQRALGTMPTSQKLDYLDKMRTSVNDPAAYRSILQQITPDSPVTMAAGSLMAATDPVTTAKHWFKPDETMNSREVAGVMMEGEALLNKTSAQKGQDGSSRGFPMPKEELFRQEFNAAVGNSFAGMPQAADTAYQSVKAYYAGMSARTGNLASREEPDSTLLTKAVKAVTGGVVDYNGRGKILTPWGMPADVFNSAIADKFNVAMEANGLKGSNMADLRLYGLQGTGDGKYLLRNGTDYLKSPLNGEPIVVDVNGPPSTATPNNVVPLAVPHKNVQEVTGKIKR